jgi:hypothetical protein
VSTAGRSLTRSAGVGAVNAQPLARFVLGLEGGFDHTLAIATTR